MTFVFLALWIWAGLTLYYAKRDELRSIDSEGAKLFVFLITVIFWPLYMIGDIVMGDR